MKYYMYPQKYNIGLTFSKLDMTRQSEISAFFNANEK